MEIYIDTDRCNYTVKIFVFDGGESHRTCYYYDKGELKTVERDMNAVSFKSWAKPLIELPQPFFDELQQSILSDAVNKGIKTKDGSFKDGKIEAMGAHMDMMTDIINKTLKLRE